MAYLLKAIQKQTFSGKSLTTQDKARFLSILGKPAKSYLAEVNKAQVKSDKLADKQIHTVAQVYATEGGNIATGQLLSAACLACHQIGDQGVNLAPALGGYKDRDPEHLLTAIIKPNAAIEKGYEVYRIIQRDGTISEGFLFNQTKYGTTIATAGGGKTYLPNERIQRQSFVNGHSNMPAFSALPEQQLRDLVAYLKTL